MMQVASYGDRISPGTYTRHSAFRTAVNFSAGSGFVFVVSPEVGAGPLNIVLAGTPPESVSSLTVGNDGCFLNAEWIPFSSSSRFISEIILHDGSPSAIRSNLATFRTALLRFAPQGSIAFLIDPARNAEFPTASGQYYIRRMTEGTALLSGGDISAGIRVLRGLGPGLTPSGDDCIAGFLTAMHLAGRLTGGIPAEQITPLASAAAGGNPFTNSFLRCAGNGWVNEKMLHLIRSLCAGRESEIEGASRRLLDAGASSGADTGIGLFIGLQRWFS